MRDVLEVLTRRWLILALVASLALLAIAQAFEIFGGLEPCHMCLQQRQAYWAAAAIAAIGLAAEQVWPGRWRRLIPAALTLVFLVGGAIAVRQAGAEWKWWPAPESCSGVRFATAADIARAMKGLIGPAPRCDQAAWRFLGLSMAGWNALASLKLAVLSAWAAIRSR